MAKSFNSLRAFEKNIMPDIKKKIDSALDNEVADAVKDVVGMNIWRNVYDAYSPIVYVRREDNDGLIAPENLKHEVKNGTLRVWNIAKPNRDPAYDDGFPLKGYLDVHIVQGYGDMDEPWNEPRPFYESAEAELEEDKAHINALDAALEKKGLKRVK
jgi:hypothetical protein